MYSDAMSNVNPSRLSHLLMGITNGSEASLIRRTESLTWASPWINYSSAVLPLANVHQYLGAGHSGGTTGSDDKGDIDVGEL